MRDEHTETLTHLSPHNQLAIVSVISSNISVRRSRTPTGNTFLFHVKYSLGKTLCQLHAVVPCVLFSPTSACGLLVTITLSYTAVNARTNWSTETKGPQQLVSFIIYYFCLSTAHSGLLAWQSASERGGVKITTSTGIHRDDIELGHRRVVDASRHRPDNIVEFNREVPSVHVHGQKSDGLSLNSNVDLEGESKSRSMDNRIG